MAEQFSFERIIKKARKSTARMVGGLAASVLVACSPAGCEARVPQASPTVAERPDCLLNGRPDDPQPNLLTNGEAVSVFPGTVELKEFGVAYMRPVIALGHTGVEAAYELMYKPDQDGFELRPITQDFLKDATWKLDTSVGKVDKPEATVEKDQCSPGTIAGRVKTHAQIVVLQDIAESPLTNQAYPDGLVLKVPLAQPDVNGIVSVGQWQASGVFGVGVESDRAAEMQQTGVAMASVKVAVN